MPINCNQPNVYQYGESWTTEANEYHTLCAAVSRNSIENSGGTGRLARQRSHGTVRRRLAGGAAANCECISVYCSFRARDITLVCS